MQITSDNKYICPNFFHLTLLDVKKKNLIRSIGFYAIAVLLSLLILIFLYYHFRRAPGHPFLAAYFTVPFAVLLTLWVLSEKPIFVYFDNVSNKIQINFLNSAAIGSIIICLFISTGGIYYAPVFMMNSVMRFYYVFNC